MAKLDSIAVARLLVELGRRTALAGNNYHRSRAYLRAAENLAAMAELGDGPVRSAAVAIRAGYKERGSTSALRESLLRKDLVYSPRRGLIDFTVPLFAAYLREQHPLSSFVEE